jgi:DNA repair ATPase RecN
MIKVRVKNFQSLVDCEMLIDGFTTLTGKNNTGKSALIRAIYSMFTNPTYLPIANDITKPVEVELTGDGFHILWKKSKTDNMYVIDGVTYEKVDRDLPEALNKIGINSININGKTIFPQFAMQLTGQLFLTNMPGSYLSEAVADTDSVQLLTDAYKLSEKSRKNATSELKIRKKDLVDTNKTLASYDSFFSIKDEFEILTQDKSAIDLLTGKIKILKDIYTKITTCKNTLSKLVNVNSVISDMKELKFDDINILLEKRITVTDLLKNYSIRKKELNSIEAFDSKVESNNIENLILCVGDIKKVFNSYFELLSLRSKIENQRKVLDEIPDVEDPVSVDEVNKLKQLFNLLTSLNSLIIQRRLLSNEICDTTNSVDRLVTEHSQIKKDIAVFLKQQGKCPVCSV